jgi:hypothetical protein
VRKVVTSMVSVVYAEAVWLWRKMVLVDSPLYFLNAFLDLC